MHAAADRPHLIELSLPPRAEVVAIARLVVGALASIDPAFDEERGADLRLAVSEALTNAIQAQRAVRDGAGSTAPIELRCALSDSCIELEVRDHGGGFDPGRVPATPPPTADDRLDHEGGLGLPLIRLLADELHVRPSPGGTTVVMSFTPRHGGERSRL